MNDNDHDDHRDDQEQQNQLRPPPPVEPDAVPRFDATLISKFPTPPANVMTAEPCPIPAPVLAAPLAEPDLMPPVRPQTTPPPPPSLSDLIPAQWRTSPSRRLDQD